VNTQQIAVGERNDAAARKEVKRQRREAQLETRRRLEAAQRRRQSFIWGGGIVLVVAALAALIWWLAHPEPGPEVQSPPIQGAVHIQHGATHPAYDSKPPTSGWHFADQVAAWGVVTTPWPDELQVHALEHGGVIVSYDCPDGCAEDVAKLETIVRAYPSKVILQPYPGIGHRVALTAWGKLAYLDSVNEAFIRHFISDYKNKGPEFIPD
jgi:hypothetical protein